MKMEIDEKQIKAIEKVLDYLWHDEERHFEDCKERDHIFRSLRVVDKWLATNHKD